MNDRLLPPGGGILLTLAGLVGLGVLCWAEGPTITFEAFALLMTILVISAEWEKPVNYDVWCGCDGEGMAHRPGAKGFYCGSGK